MGILETTLTPSQLEARQRGEEVELSGEQASRFQLAYNEALHAERDALQARVKELEDVLRPDGFGTCPVCRRTVANEGKTHPHAPLCRARFALSGAKPRPCGEYFPADDCPAECVTRNSGAKP